MPEIEPHFAIELRGITKRFGAVLANDNADLAVRRGAIHGIVGENGAGKSTLMGILQGVHQPDGGTIRVDGREVVIPGSRDAILLGIDMVHQHFMLVGRFTVLENVLLGAEGGPILRRGAGRARAELARLADAYGLQVDPDTRVEHLPVGAQQRVEILKALYRGARTLILDEPTAVLTPGEAENLFRVLRALRDQGRTVAHRDTADTSPAELGELMIGRRLPAPARPGQAAPGPVRLEARSLCVCDDAGVLRVRDVTLQVRAGEVLGIAGVAGNGQTELLEALAGMRAPSAGKVLIDGRPLPPDAAAARRAGVAHVPEDRLRTGLLPRDAAAANAVLGYARDPAFRRFGLLSPSRIRTHAARLMRDYDVRPLAPTLRAALFSGGNQQKLILAREMERDPLVLLVGQPTRGVDISGIAAIHARIAACRARGTAVLLVSVELDEILALSDRVAVMCGGVVTATFAAAEATEERIAPAMAGAA